MNPQARIGLRPGHLQSHGTLRTMASSAVMRLDSIRAEIRADLDGLDGRQVVIPMTCSVDGCEHAVSEARFVSADHGRYVALCGAWVVPGSLFEAPGRVCRACLARQCAIAPSGIALGGVVAGRHALRRVTGCVRRWAHHDSHDSRGLVAGLT